VLVASGSQALEARLPLSPLVSERIVGPLVPLAVGIEKPPGEGPLGIVVRDFRLPLDRNLAGLDATIELELGQVAFQLLPGLSEILASFGRKISQQTAAFEPFSLRIEQGVVGYDGLPITLQGHDLRFSGSFDLASKEFDLDASVPLAILGEGVVRELDKVRELLDPNLAVPLEISGSWNKPKVSIGKDFLDTTVKQAAEGALGRGLRGLLEKQLGGD
jgi:hypothetical protein